MNPEATTSRADATPSKAQAALEEERDFLIRSLRDLEAERDAGDIDEGDYAALRDDYTVRAARILRRLESPDDPADDELVGADTAVSEVMPAPDATAGATEVRSAIRSRTGARRPWSRWQVLAVVAIVVIVAGLIGWQVGHNSSARQAGETITGGNTTTGGALSNQQVSQLLLAAEAEAVSNPVDAIKDYDRILTTYPAQPQALTEEGWIYAQAGLLSEAHTRLQEAETADPSYDPAYGYLGIVLFGQKDYTDAVTQLSFYLSHGPNPALKSEATQALAAAKIDAKATTAGSTPTTPTP